MQRLSKAVLVRATELQAKIHSAPEHYTKVDIDELVVALNLISVHVADTRELVVALVSVGAAIAPGAGALDDLQWILQAGQNAAPSELIDMLATRGPSARLAARALSYAGPRAIPALLEFLA